jgi:hypothetical protein
MVILAICLGNDYADACMMCHAERYPVLDEKFIWAMEVSHPVLWIQKEYGE